MVEDDFRWKTTFGGRQPLVEDNLWWKTTFGGRQLLVEDDLCMLPSPLCSIFFYCLIPFNCLNLLKMLTLFLICLTHAVMNKFCAC